METRAQRQTAAPQPPGFPSIQAPMLTPAPLDSALLPVAAKPCSSSRPREKAAREPAPRCFVFFLLPPARHIVGAIEPPPPCIALPSASRRPGVAPRLCPPGSPDLCSFPGTSLGRYDGNLPNCLAIQEAGLVHRPPREHDPGSGGLRPRNPSPPRDPDKGSCRKLFISTQRCARLNRCSPFWPALPSPPTPARK